MYTKYKIANDWIVQPLKRPNNTPTVEKFFLWVQDKLNQILSLAEDLHLTTGYCIFIYIYIYIYMFANDFRFGI